MDINKIPHRVFSYFDYHNLVSIPESDCIIHSKEKLANNDLVFQNQNRIKKLLFFLIREGLSRFYLKIRAKLLFDRAINHNVFIVAQYKKDQRFYYGFQYSWDQKIYYFLQSNISSAFPENIPDIVKHYNPFSGYSLMDIPQNGNFKPIEYISSVNNIKNNRELFLIGGGRYTLTEILPILKNYYYKAICDFNDEILNLGVYEKFEYRTNDFSKIISLNSNNKNEKLCVVSSYHSYHTRQAVEFLKLDSSKVILEKPPCVTLEDFESLLSVYDEERLFISYHRRYAPWNLKIKELLANSEYPFIANFQIKEKKLSSYHWYYWPNQGTRITGNLCHWIDLSIFFFGKPSEIFISKNPLGVDLSNFSILFSNNSLASFSYSDYGDLTRGVQENINIKGNDIEIILNDYLSLTIWSKGRMKNKRNIRRDKGHKKMNLKIKSYIDNNLPSDYSKKDFIYTTLTYIKIVELMKSDQSSLKLDFSQFEDNESANPTA
jgi:predicted dehydrogenase